MSTREYISDADLIQAFDPDGTTYTVRALEGLRRVADLVANTIDAMGKADAMEDISVSLQSIAESMATMAQGPGPEPREPWQGETDEESEQDGR